MGVSYTDDQREAINALGENVIVSAGAGSGKTAVLKQRVIHLVKDKGFTINQFLILTFTNLAAGEMKERIRNGLSNESEEERKLAESLTDPLEKEKHLDASERLRVASEGVDTAMISTFDSYALKLVKKYHFMLNVSPNITNVSGQVIRTKKRKILEEIFEREYEKDSSPLTDLIKEYCFKDDTEIVDLILNIFGNAYKSNDMDEYLNSYEERFYSQEFIDSFILSVTDEIYRRRQELSVILNNLPDIMIKAKGKTFADLSNDLFSWFMSANSYDDLMNTYPFDFSIRKPSGCDSQDGELIDKFTVARASLKEFLGNLPQSTDDIRFAFSQRKVKAGILIDIVKELNEKIKEYKEETQAFEFEDISKKALYLLKNFPEVREEIKNQFKTIMVDEYQDTSLVQDTFLSLITNNDIYMVGDIKQSIYRFRNARCDLFQSKYNEYQNSPNERAIDLNRNFRSRSEVLSDINTIFSGLMSDRIGAADYCKNHMIEWGNSMYGENRAKGQNYHSDFLVYGDGEEKINRKDVSEIEAEMICKDIISKINNHYLVFASDKGKNYLRPCVFSDFCIIMDRGTSFSSYSRVFNKNKIPLFVQYNEDIKLADVIQISENILKMIKIIKTGEYSSKDFKHAFYSIARSFIGSYSDSQLLAIEKGNSFFTDPLFLTIKDTVYESNQVTDSQVIRNVFSKLGFVHKLIEFGEVDKNSRIIDTFLDEFDSMSKLDYSFDDFIQLLENYCKYNEKLELSNKASSLDSVMLMNVHQSKGLEFSIIYFAGLSNAFNRRSLSKAYIVSDDYGLILPDNDKLGYLKTLYQQHEIELDVSEKIRLFYVALTRAKEKMIFVIKNNVIFNSELRNDYLTKNNLADDFPSSDSYRFAVESYFRNEISFNFLKIIIPDIPGEYLILTDDERKANGVDGFLSTIPLPLATTAYDVKNADDRQEMDDSLKEEMIAAYQDYKNGFSSFTDLEKICQDNDVLIDPNFKAMKDSERKILKPDESYKNIFFGKKVPILDDEKIEMKSFSNLITPFITLSRFEKKVMMIDEPCPEVSVSNQRIEHPIIKVRNLSIDKKPLNQMAKASKNLKIFSSREAMEFGTRIHFMMEITDFTNPDYELLPSEYFRNIVRRFLASDLMKDVSKGSIYKEYEFIDETKNTNGIIDLMVIYPDHIDIIDYKTKNLDDVSYDKQIKIYMDFAQKTFALPVKGYLYSLLDSVFREIK
ncbi:MAG: UvrD-helicase domain-containing protein [Bacilli bacterium]